MFVDFSPPYSTFRVHHQTPFDEIYGFLTDISFVEHNFVFVDLFQYLLNVAT